jgi:hypothetical protein
MKKRRKKSASLFHEQQVDAMFTTLRELVRRDLREPLTGLPEGAWEFVRSYQNTSIGKKFIYSGSNPQTRQSLAYEKFGGINAHIRDVNSSFAPPIHERFSRENSFIQNRLVLARRYMSAILGDFSVEEWFQRCKTSSGASIGVSYADTSPEAKFKYPISCTPDALDLFKSYLAFDHRLKASIELLNVGSDLKSERFRLVESSRATTVPKSFEIDRMIAIEPTANMYLQLGLMEIFYDRLRSFGIDVTRQPDRHKYLARKGSIDGSLATIDFSSASDCVSIELLRYLLPKKWFHLVERLRCPSMSLNGRDVKLEMISTMGNATTFPLETLVFYTLGCACIQLARYPRGTLPELDPRRRVYDLISVFGDDCILPTEHAVDFIRLTEGVGFIVNKEKSFYDYQPGFRESCGGDFLHGCDVRPFFIERPASLSKASIESWLYLCVNKVLKKYILYFGPVNYIYEKHALRYLFRKLKEIRKHPFAVPPSFPEDAGINEHDARLPRCYDISLYRPAISQHGNISFLYNSFVYRKKKESNDDLRYAILLKRKSYVSEKKRTKWEISIRRKGGYLVARGSTVHWTWPYDH